MFMFAVLFGLIMDYEVFLLSRIREEYVDTRRQPRVGRRRHRDDGTRHHVGRVDHERRCSSRSCSTTTRR